MALLRRLYSGVYLGGYQVTNNGNIDVRGGNGAIQGGDGGYVGLYSYGDTNTVNSGTLTVTGGTPDGTDGEGNIDGNPVAP